MLDLIDNTPGEQNVADAVTGLTIQQLFNSLQTNTTNMAQYKANLIALNPRQQTAIGNLFTSYGY